MSLQPTDTAIVAQLIQRIPGFPKSKKGQARRIQYHSQGWVQSVDLSGRGLTQVPTELGQLSRLE